VDELDTVKGILARRDARIALVGASNAPQKYGNIILRDLRGLGYTVLPVNRREQYIEGETAYASLAELPPPVDIINVVVPPEQALAVVEGAQPSQCPVVWFQPGAFDQRVVEAARLRFPTVLAGDCIMVVARQVTRR
jgi:predicted CoA-binding protein